MAPALWGMALSACGKTWWRRKGKMSCQRPMTVVMVELILSLAVAVLVISSNRDERAYLRERE
jgi:hypothetical protein